MAYKVLTTGASPISLPEFKAHAFIEDSAEDDLLSLYLSSACENFGLLTGFVIPETEFLLTITSFQFLKIYRGPITEITEIKYKDVQGIEKTIDPATVHYSDDRPSTIMCENGWPQTSGMPDAVQIKFKAGHALSDQFPMIVKWAILVLAATAYENREEVITGTIVSPIPNSAQMVIDRYAILEV